MINNNKLGDGVCVCVYVCVCVWGGGMKQVISTCSASHFVSPLTAAKLFIA